MCVKYLARKPKQNEDALSSQFIYLCLKIRIDIHALR